MSRNQTTLSRDQVGGRVNDFQRIPFALWGILGISLISKLALIDLNWGEYTDGIIQLELWNSPVVFFPPGYSAAVWIVHWIVPDLLIAGRLVSILASVGSLWVCFQLGRKVLAKGEAAAIATLFLSLSPVFNRWSLRVMTDSLFLFLFLICFLQWIHLSQEYRRTPVRFLGWIGIATLVRYQGLFFLPFALILIWQRRATLWQERKIRLLVDCSLSFLPWLALVGWIGYRGFGHTQQFMERGSYGLWTTLALYYSMFETYLLYWPWAVTYSLFVCGIAGIIGLYRGNREGRQFLVFSLITAIVFLIVQSCFLSFQYRYLLPLIPLWCIVAAQGWDEIAQRLKSHSVRIVLGTLVFVNLSFMTVAVLYFQRSAFGDLVESARYIHSAKFQRQVPEVRRILSDETYRDGVYNAKMIFWSGEKDRLYYYPLTEPQVGDVVILHNAYSDLVREEQRLQERFTLQRLQTWSPASIWSEFATLPLLPDIMVNPPTPPLTSNPPCMAFRFAPQYYYSEVLLLKEK